MSACHLRIRSCPSEGSGLIEMLVLCSSAIPARDAASAPQSHGGACEMLPYGSPARTADAGFGASFCAGLRPDPSNHCSIIDGACLSEGGISLLVTIAKQTKIPNLTSLRILEARKSDISDETCRLPPRPWDLNPNRSRWQEPFQAKGAGAGRRTRRTISEP